MNTVFISHAATDSVIARGISSILQEQGIFAPTEEFNSNEESLALILQADIFVSLFHANQPNLFFELGYAMGSGHM